MIRPYQPADLKELLETWAAASAIAHPFLSADFLAAERRNIPDVYLPNAETWVWESDGRVVGFIALLGHEVGALFVAPSFHRRGIGRALMDHARGLCGQLEVEVFQDNTLGRTFYESYGFELLQEKVHEQTGFNLLRLRLGANQCADPRGEQRIEIATARLKLIPATVALARAEIDDRGAFTRLLGASVPENWPPESLADALPLFLGWMEAAPEQVGWFGWYALAIGDGTTAPFLVASGGFKGPPRDGTAEIGYSVLPQFQGRGYATELVVALVQWTLRQSGVSRVVAETEWANPASVRVLHKAGFVERGQATEPGGARFEFVGDA